jgi:hypothetical protein
LKLHGPLLDRGVLKVQNGQAGPFRPRDLL